jgi:Uma2 family endonuclease
MSECQAARQPHSFDEYVELEAISAVKHEFRDGEVWAIAGGSPEHAAVAGNVVRLLGQALLHRRCRVFTSDLRVRIQATGLGTYPDASAICDAIELDPADHKGHTALNPTLILEVLSPTTEPYDQGEKLASYKLIPSLCEIVLVAHDERRIDLWRRRGSAWTQLTFRGDEPVVLESLGDVRLDIADIYFDPLADRG